jgi:hypothetical protein
MTSSCLGHLIVRVPTVVILRNFMASKDGENPKKARPPPLRFIVVSWQAFRQQSAGALAARMQPFLGSKASSAIP